MVNGKVAAPNRHSRVSGNPAVACQDYGLVRQCRRDSRLRGNDGGGGQQPFYTDAQNPVYPVYLCLNPPYPIPASTAAAVAPMSAGVGMMWAPASRKAAILAAAVALSPVMMAPA